MGGPLCPVVPRGSGSCPALLTEEHVCLWGVSGAGCGRMVVEPAVCVQQALFSRGPCQAQLPRWAQRCSFQLVELLSGPAGQQVPLESQKGAVEVGGPGGSTAGPRLGQGATRCLEEGTLFGLRSEGQLGTVMAHRRSQRGTLTCPAWPPASMGSWDSSGKAFTWSFRGSWSPASGVSYLNEAGRVGSGQWPATLPASLWGEAAEGCLSPGFGTGCGAEATSHPHIPLFLSLLPHGKNWVSPRCQLGCAQWWFGAAHKSAPGGVEGKELWVRVSQPGPIDCGPWGWAWRDPACCMCTCMAPADTCPPPPCLVCHLFSMSVVKGGGEQEAEVL